MCLCLCLCVCVCVSVSLSVHVTASPLRSFFRVRPCEGSRPLFSFLHSEQELRERLAGLGHRRDELSRQLSVHARRHAELRTGVFEHLAKGCALAPEPRSLGAVRVECAGAESVSPAGSARSEGEPVCAS